MAYYSSCYTCSNTRTPLRLVLIYVINTKRYGDSKIYQQECDSLRPDCVQSVVILQLMSCLISLSKEEIKSYNAAHHRGASKLFSISHVVHFLCTVDGAHKERKESKSTVKVSQREVTPNGILKTDNCRQ